MLDTVHLMMPRIVEYARDFIPKLEATKSGTLCDEVWRKQNGNQPYKIVGNFEPLGIPVLVHQQPRWDHKAGDKVELLGASKMTVADMVHTVRQIYRFNAADAEIMRLDLTADVKGVPVSWFRQHVRVRYKKKHRTWGHWTEISSAVAETIMAGDRPNPVRIYDKIGEMQHQIAAMRRKLPREHREQCTIDNVFGHSADDVLARVERQMGARSPAKVWGLKYFGDVSDVMNKRPFANMVFPETARRYSFENLDGMDQMAVLYLLEFRKHHGLQNALNEMKRRLPKRTYWRKLPLYEQALHSNFEDNVIVTEASVTEEFRASTMEQLCPAA